MVRHFARRISWAMLAAVLLVGRTPGTASAQDASLTGRVVESDTGEPLPGVNVFLDETTLGAATDAAGEYEILRVPPGSYRIVASSVGFGVQTRDVVVVPETGRYRIDFRLEPKVLELSEVQVEAEKPHGWERNLRRFTEAFLGSSPNARETEILNPHVLDFEVQDETLRADASAPLIVENRALGYRITVALSFFSYEHEPWILSYGGPIHFEEMQAAGDAEASRWSENRKETYRGSAMHLYRSLIEGTTRKEGFIVMHEFVLGGKRKRADLGLIPFLEATERPYLYRLSFEDALYVEFGREVSKLRMNRDEVLLHAAGYLYTFGYEVPPPVTVSGALTSRRIADMLPRDYEF